MNGDELNKTEGSTLTLDEGTLKMLLRAAGVPDNAVLQPGGAGGQKTPKSTASAGGPTIQDSLKGPSSPSDGINKVKPADLASGKEEEKTLVLDESMIQMVQRAAGVKPEVLASARIATALAPELNQISETIGKSLNIKMGEMENQRDFNSNFKAMQDGTLKKEDPNALWQPTAERATNLREGYEIVQQERNEIEKLPEYGFADTLEKIGMAAAVLAMPLGALPLAMMGVMLAGTGKRLKDDSLEAWRISSNKMMASFLDDSDDNGVKALSERKGREGLLSDIATWKQANPGATLPKALLASMAANNGVADVVRDSIDPDAVPVSAEDMSIGGVLSERERTELHKATQTYKAAIDKNASEFYKKIRRARPEDRDGVILSEIYKEESTGGVKIKDIHEYMHASENTISSVTALERANTRSEDEEKYNQRTPFTDKLGSITPGFGPGPEEGAKPVEVTDEEKKKYQEFRDVVSGESFIEAANRFLKTMMEDGKFEERNGGWMFVFPTTFKQFEMGFEPLIDHVWRQKNPPTKDQAMDKLDEVGFSKEAHSRYMGSVMALGN